MPDRPHAHTRARWAGRILHVELKGRDHADTTVGDANRIGQLVTDRVALQLPEMGSFTWITHGA